MGRIVVDSSAWSVALRRRDPARLSPLEAAVRSEVGRAAEEGDAVMLGVVRQELLNGVTPPERFEALRVLLRAFEDEHISTEDHERAAEMYNRCRAAGVQGSVVDFLVCAVAERLRAPVLTLDQDFARFAGIFSIPLHPPQ